MFVQIEISTHCNFTCFYCAGRDMAQEYMPIATFEDILGNLPAGQHIVCLQGEGEPTLHPGFWDMAERIRQSGHVPYTITNGSRIAAERMAEVFPTIAISLDTLDPAEAERIGRKKLSKVLANFDRLIAAMGPGRIIVVTVDYGQPLDSLKTFVRGKGIVQHMIQPLQVKADYRRRYPDFPAPQELYTYRCRYLEQALHRTYDMHGHVFPCCHIKDPAGFDSIESLRASIARSEVPACCSGCREILVNTKQPQLLVNQSVTAPTISFVVSSKNRLDHLRRTLPTLIAQPDSNTIVVDYACAQESGAWAAATYPTARVVRVEQATDFNKARASNLGAAQASGQWICFVDADVLLAADFFAVASAQLRPGTFLRFSAQTPGLVICSREDFRAIGGFDETFVGWGCEDDDLQTRLRLFGLQPQMLPGGLFSIIEHGDEERTAHHVIADKWLSLRINGMYFQIKTDLARTLGMISLPQDDLRRIYDEVRRTILANPAGPAEIRVDMPPQTDFRQPPNWRLQREWIYRFLPAATTAPAAFTRSQIAFS